MRLVIVSGLSGSGKSTALHTLEDLDFYCIDNLPVGMLPAFVEQISGSWGQTRSNYAVGMDARSSAQELESFPQLLRQLRQREFQCTVVFLQSDEPILLKRFSETRRKHPLSSSERSLADSVRLERSLLEAIAAEADVLIDTTQTTVHQLRDLVRERLLPGPRAGLSLTFSSFGFKHGVPADADFVFDARCLPNPHWVPDLRTLTGRDAAVCDYLGAQPPVQALLADVRNFVEKWLSCFEADNRSYLTVAVGCTGGMHRSVYLTEALAAYFRKQRPQVLVRHRELP